MSLDKLLARLEDPKLLEKIPEQRLKYLANLFSTVAGSNQSDKATRHLLYVLAKELRKLERESPQATRNFALYILNYRPSGSNPISQVHRRVARHNEHGLIREQIEAEILNYYGDLSLQQRSNLNVQDIMRDNPKVGELVLWNPTSFGAYLGVIMKSSKSRIEYDRPTRTYTIHLRKTK